MKNKQTHFYSLQSVLSVSNFVYFKKIPIQKLISRNAIKDNKVKKKYYLMKLRQIQMFIRQQLTSRINQR